MFCLAVRMHDNECVRKSFVVPVPKFPFDTKFSSDTKFLSDVLTLKYTLLFLRPQTPGFWHQKKGDLCSDGGGGLHLCERHITFRK